MTTSDGPVEPVVVEAVVLVVLAKAPVPGQAKTRLTPPFTEHQAAGLAAAALLDTLDAVTQAHRRLGGPTPVVALAGDVSRGAAPEAVQAALEQLRVVPQRGDGLAERIAAAHADAAATVVGGARTATLQIGMDTPQVTADLLVDAAGRLTRPDGPAGVLGPAADGGWWVLGLRDPQAAVLVVEVEMSTPFTFERTRQALRRGGITAETLSSLVDVDDAAACTTVAEAAPATRFAALARTLAPRRTHGDAR